MVELNKYISKFKQTFAGRKARMSIYVLGVLWIAVIMQFAVNKMLQPNKNLLEAFISTNSNVSSFDIEIAGKYSNKYLSESDKKELVQYLASEIGLILDEPVTVNREGNDTEVFVQKTGKNAETLIKIVSIEQKNTSGISETKHYVLTNLKLFNNIDSIMTYRTLLNNVFQDLGVTDIQTNMQAIGRYKGKLTLEQMNYIADGMIESLQGSIVYGNRMEDLYTIYAYSGLIDEYITSLDSKINIHVAVNYDESNDITEVKLASPIINGDY